MVVCETEHAMCYHLRIGEFEPCGHQSTDALCGLHPAWDTKVPVKWFKGPHKHGMCSSCHQIFQELKKEFNDVKR